MAGPWEQYQTQPAQGPWTGFAQTAQPEPPKQDRSTLDVLTGWDGGERYQTWPERMVRGIAQGAASAATLPGDVYAGRQQVDMNDPDFVRRTQEFSALLSGANPAVRSGDRAIPGMMQAPLKALKPQVPTTRELQTAGARDISAAKQSGLDITASSVAEHSRRIQRELFEEGVHPVDAPATFAKLKELEGAPADAVFTASNLQSLRRSLQKTAQNFNPNGASDQLAASRAISGFDQFLPQLDAESVLAGSPSATQALFERGRGNYAAAMRSNEITGNLDRARTGILERAEARAQAANSGRNIDNAIRQRAESALEKPKEISGYTDAEIAALDQVVQGGPVRNSARYVGNFLGGGGGLGQFLTTAAGAGAGAATGDLATGLAVGAIPVATGVASRALANQLAKRDLSQVDKLLRMRSPLYQERVANPELVLPSPDPMAAAIRAWLLGEQGRDQ